MIALLIILWVVIDVAILQDLMENFKRASQKEKVWVIIIAGAFGPIIAVGNLASEVIEILLGEEDDNSKWPQ